FRSPRLIYGGGSSHRNCFLRIQILECAQPTQTEVNMRKTVLLVTAFLSITLAANRPVRAQEPSPFQFQYAVKFICGTSPAGRFQVLARGTYLTSINIHNPLVGNV